MDVVQTGWSATWELVFFEVLTTKAQQEAIDNIQCLLEQLLNNQNTNANHDKTFDSNLQEEKNLNENAYKDEQQHSKETSSGDAKVIKGIHDQITSLAQRNVLKKVRVAHPYPLEWDSVPIHQISSSWCIHMMARAHGTSISITSDPKLAI